MKGGEKATNCDIPVSIAPTSPLTINVKIFVHDHCIGLFLCTADVEEVIHSREQSFWSVDFSQL